MKKFISLVLALVLALSLTTVAWGADVAKIGNTGYATLADAVTAVPTDGTATTITLLDSVTLTDSITIANGMNVTFEGNGKTITSAANKDAFRVVGGTLTLAAGLSVHSETDCAVFFPNPSKGTLISSANLSASGVYATIQGNGTAGHTGTTITINGGSVTSAHSVAIYHPQTGTLTINDGTVSGYESGIAIKSGTLTVNGGTVRCTGPDASPTTGYSNGVNASGAAIQIESNADYVGNVVVNVKGGTVKSDNGAALYEYNAGTNSSTPTTDTTVDSVSVSGGTVVGKVQISSELAADGTVTVSGGTFTTDVRAYAAPGFTLTQNAGGGYTANPDTAGSSTAALYDLYTATVPAVEVAGDAAYTTVAAVKNENGSGVLEYVKMDGKLFVKIPANKATINDFYVTAANQKVAQFYLKQIDSVADVTYAFTAVNFTNLGVKCDQMNAAYLDYTANEVGFYLHTSALGVKTYYADGAVTTGAPYYNNAVLATTATNILVGTEIVEAYAFTSDPLNQHVWAPSGYDKTTPVTALCGICGAKANLYTAAKTPASSLIVDVLSIGGTNYNVVMTSTGSAGSVVTPSTDKVESAQTFDAGIAMYVGMSVMAAAGSVVVLKKRED